ncbi:putative pre-rrna processing protein [Diaporthe ampelina]|uniref:Putative pre-rrna processing protein n=1 Tax=Diaporthe ampelina TaxID=1214573 RepID=A0A0G2FB34_9PEZI|nr:putative pre-rrna processing protein [Diaporthe ampelina]
MSSRPPKKRDGAQSAKIKDSRFASFETDPRYALPSKKKSKTTIDKRFSRMLKDDEFTAVSRVDKYGRKIKSDSKKKALQRLYQDEDEDQDVEVEDDDIVQRELEKAQTKYDPARGGGFSSSDSDTDSESESADEYEDAQEEVDNAPDMQKYRTQQTEVETGEVTNRIAIVNIDWDNIKSIDLMALFKSFVPISGRIEKVSIYPSEFGKERMQREELEGPPKEIFKKSKADKESDESEGDGEVSEDDQAEDSDEEAKQDLLKEGNDEDFDSDALRTYQLDRLRYYYAVMVCSDKNTAQKIYEATDGSEYLSSSNFLDLRFVPDDITFDDEPRDECEGVPENYKPVEFVTDALQHSKVKLTWDVDPEEVKRKESIKNAFSGSRADLAENDLRVYLASDSDEEEEEQEDAGEATAAPKLSKKELARKKMREALGLSDEPADKATGSGPVGDMEITFTPALTESSGGKKNPEDETTAEKYIRKERERKARKKEQAAAKGGDASEGAADEPEEDLGFDDPFFTIEEPKPASKAQLHKEERRKKREAREDEEKKSAVDRAKLELLMADNHDEETGHMKHFNMDEILKAEKKKNKKKSKKAKKDKEDAGGLQENFKINAGDDRFKALFEEHDFAIDPSDPKFKAASGMKQLVEEGRKKRKHGGGGDGAEEPRERGPKKTKAGGQDLDSLVKSLKKKADGKK